MNNLFVPVFLFIATFCGAVHLYGQGQLEKDAVFVGLTKDRDSKSGPVLFDREETDVRGSYDIIGGKFYAYKSGIYWVSFSGGAKAKSKYDFRLMKSGTHYAGNTAWNSYHNGTDTKSRDIIVSVTSGQTLHMESTDGPQFSDFGLQTSLCLFRLTSFMNTTISFSVGRTNSYNPSNDGILPFETVLVNEGGAFDTAENTFIVPKEGYYFLSYSATPGNNLPFELNLRRNAALLNQLTSNSSSTIYYQTMSRAGLFYFLKDDRVSIHMKGGGYLYEYSSRLYNSFSGFHYSPLHGQKIGWSVARTTGWQGSRSLSPITFERVLVNLGSGWDRSKNMFVVPVAGVYYVTYTIGSQTGKAVDVSLMVDSEEKASITRTSTAHNGTDILSRSAVLLLKMGSQVYLEAHAYTALHSDMYRQTTFSGIFLYTHPIPSVQM